MSGGGELAAGYARPRADVEDPIARIELRGVHDLLDQLAGIRRADLFIELGHTAERKPTLERAATGHDGDARALRLPSFTERA